MSTLMGPEVQSSIPSTGERQHRARPATRHRVFPLPSGWSAYPSRPDLNADPKRLQSDAGRLGKDRPYAAGIIASRPRRETDEPEWSFRAYEYREDGPPARTEATAVRVPRNGTEPAIPGRALPQKLATAFSAQGPEGPGLTEGTVAQDSTVELWGDRGQKASQRHSCGHHWMRRCRIVACRTGRSSRRWRRCIR